MRMTSVSVSILTHDRPRELLECVNSLIEQTVLPKEIIIVDNSSKNMSDVLSKIVDQVKRKSIQIKIVKGRDPYSVPIGRNQGLEAVSCEFVLICDDDVILTNIILKRCSKRLRNTLNL
jgi:GT2 family glycosyltransferase